MIEEIKEANTTEEEWEGDILYIITKRSEDI
jgi:hypothetical protein